MPKIKISGVIIPNDHQEIYDWFGLEATSPRKVENQLNEINGDVTIEINSGGGSLFSGSEIYTLLKDYPHNVTVKVTGVAASAASVIMMAGDRILMSPTSQMMIHNATVRAEGDYHELESATQLLKNANQTAVNAYKLKSGLDDNELLELMDKETWFTAHQALEKGLIDEVMFEQVQVVANFGDGFLPQEVISKIKNELLKNKSANEQPTDESDFLLSKLQLLKLKGEMKNEL